MTSGIVEGINQNEETDAVNFIWVTINKGSRQLVKASPLNMNFRQIPILGEMVYLVKASSDESSGVSNSEKYYYVSPVGIHRNINHNAMPNYNELSTSGGGGFAVAAAGVANASSSPSENNLGTGFVEMPNIPQLQGFLGDMILEGRFGNSIRFGYTPSDTSGDTDKVSEVKVEPSWESTIPESPIMILRNGHDTNIGYNKLVIEDINDDDTSIWLTSQQTISMTPASPLPPSITPISSWKFPQLIGTSERVVLNAKKDNIILSSKKDIVFSTGANKTTMDLLISAIETLAQGTFPTAVGPTGPHPQVAQIIAKLKQGVG